MKTHEFYYGTSYYTEFVAENAKIFSRKFISKKVEPIDLWFFPKQKYGSKGPGENTKSVVIELLRFLIEKLLFLLSKIVGTLYSPIPG